MRRVADRLARDGHPTARVVFHRGGLVAGLKALLAFGAATDSPAYRGFFGRARRDWGEAQAPTVKGLLYAYRSASPGSTCCARGDCFGDVMQLAPVYGFERVPDLVARKATGWSTTL